MEIHGGTIAGVARATSPVRETDKSRPWREAILIEPGLNAGQSTRIIASDGRMVASAITDQNSDGSGGMLRRRDAERFDKEDALTVCDGEIAVRDSELTMRLEEKLEDGNDYPEGPAEVLKLHPQGRPAFRCDPKFLRRALQGLILAGVEQCEVYVAPRAGSDGMLFLQGKNDAEDSFVFALGMPRSAERKSQTGEIVEHLEHGPLFAGAEEPPKDAEPVDGKTAAAGSDKD